MLPLGRLHDDEIVHLLASGQRQAELTAFFGEEGYAELSDLARRAESASLRGGPRVYVLPGLMGSRIGMRGRLIDDVLWLDLIEVAAGHLTRLALPSGATLTALGVMLLNTLKLKLSLTIAGFDAKFHAYDWRRSVGGLAADLNARIRRDRVGKAMIVGHSMGGVVARAALAGDKGRISRVVQIGAPNHGSFAPVLAMRGVYPSVRKLAALDRRHNAEDLARIIFRTLPSLHELLPDPRRTPGPSLFEASNWPDGALRPDPQLLASAEAARRRWPASDPRCLHIIGVRQETVTRLQRREADFEYTLTNEGDGTVPLALAELADGQAWFAAEKHGGLPNNGKVISAVNDLLRYGTTERLPARFRRLRRPRRRILSESEMRLVAPHKVHWQDLSPDARRRLLEPVVSPEFHGRIPASALKPKRHAAVLRKPKTRRSLEIRLSHGSIVDANARALVIGLFRNVDPSGAAAAVDACLDGAIAEFNLRRMFLGSLGQVFVMPATRSPLLADFVLFAGLGDFDDFGPESQTFVAENIVRTLARTRAEDFATVLLGTGSGLRVADAVQQQLTGFTDGLRHADPEQIIRRITICENNGRKYAALRRAVKKVAESLTAADLEVTVDESMPALPSMSPVSTARKAPVRHSTDPAYLLVTMQGTGRPVHECRSALLTAGAKAAVLSGASRVSRRELDETLEQIESLSVSRSELTRFGSRLSRLLLPETVREGLVAMASRPLVVLHDEQASRIPWETLTVGSGHPALERGLSRRYASDRLSVARWQDDRHPGEKMRVLMVVDPGGDLPGAAAEGDALLQVLQRSGAEVELIRGTGASRENLLRALGAAEHDVLHFAGHAFFDRRDPGNSGLVCAGGDVLRGADLGTLANLPALVFFNACEAARVRRRGTQNSTRLFGLRRSTSVAEAFLAGGVANFLGTHWPVSDDAALSFARRLYDDLFDGESLGTAILRARRVVRDRGSIDWADYVHYGNPTFRLAAGN
jgi:CHAT domain-containing protein/pimeloyl-ACP methyl ester carboxylesterase